MALHIQDCDDVPTPFLLAHPGVHHQACARSILTHGWGPQGSAHLLHGDIPDVRETVILPILLLQHRGHHGCQQRLRLDKESEKHHQRRFWGAPQSREPPSWSQPMGRRLTRPSMATSKHVTPCPFGPRTAWPLSQ